MSLIKKSDVKNHLSARRHKGIHIAPATPSDAKAMPSTDGDIEEADPTSFTKDFTGDHTTDQPVDNSIDNHKPAGFVAGGAAKV